MRGFGVLGGHSFTPNEISKIANAPTASAFGDLTRWNWVLALQCPDRNAEDGGREAIGRYSVVRQ
jgi:hypothetical protein